VLREMLPAGDANLDGTVNFSDFQIVSQDYGQSGDWWEQGNFDSQLNGTVDATDFLAMYNNLSGLTPAQWQTVNDFAAANGIVVPEPGTGVVLLGFGICLRRSRR